MSAHACRLCVSPCVRACACVCARVWFHASSECACVCVRAGACVCVGLCVICVCHVGVCVRARLRVCVGPHGCRRRAFSSTGIGTGIIRRRVDHHDVGIGGLQATARGVGVRTLLSCARACVGV